jgi:hypothetical protein
MQSQHTYRLVSTLSWVGWRTDGVFKLPLQVPVRESVSGMWILQTNDLVTLMIADQSPASVEPNAVQRRHWGPVILHVCKLQHLWCKQGYLAACADRRGSVDVMRVL